VSEHSVQRQKKTIFYKFLTEKTALTERTASTTKYKRIILASNAPPFHLEKPKKDFVHTNEWKIEPVCLN